LNKKRAAQKAAQKASKPYKKISAATAAPR
jgi:hypothetical protein